LGGGGSCAAAEGAAPVLSSEGEAAENVGMRLPPWNKGSSTLS
jgi:hypothetical protein